MDDLASKNSTSSKLPLFELIEQNTSKAIKKDTIPPSTEKFLNELFPEQAYEEKEIKRLKEALGPLANQFTQEQLRGKVQEIQYLADSWLDDFEREIFNGLTLQELLHEKGNK